MHRLYPSGGSGTCTGCQSDCPVWLHASPVPSVSSVLVWTRPTLGPGLPITQTASANQIVNISRETRRIAATFASRTKPSKAVIARVQWWREISAAIKWGRLYSFERWIQIEFIVNSTSQRISLPHGGQAEGLWEGNYGKPCSELRMSPSILHSALWSPVTITVTPRHVRLPILIARLRSRSINTLCLFCCCCCCCFLRNSS